MKKRGKLILVGVGVVVIILIVGAGLFGQKTGNKKAAPAESEIKEELFEKGEWFEVVKVVDGDTLAVDMGGAVETIRIIGINTPETVDTRKPVKCFGKEASDKAKSILEGQKIRLEADPSQGERDKYDRLLRYVFLKDGTDFGKMMIGEGFAYEYTYNTPYKYQTEYKEAEKLAKENKKGLWADGVCVEKTESGAFLNKKED